MSKILRIGGLNEIHHTDPLTAQDTKSMFVVKQLFESLYGTTFGTTDVAPELLDGPLEAVSPRRWAGRLRLDIRFSDGSLMTPENVRRSLEASGVVSDAAAISLHADEIHFELERANARFPLTLAHGQCSIVKRQGSEILGTGPFVLHPSSRPEHIRLVRNSHHHPPAKVDEVHFVHYPVDDDGRPRAMLQAIADGEVDLTTSLGRVDLSAVSGMRKKILPGTSTCFLFFNCESPKLIDARARQALGHAIDRLEVAKITYSNALAFAASSLLPRTLGAIDDPLVHDDAKANALWQALGEKAPRKLKLLMVWGPRPYLPSPTAVGENIAGQLSRLGVEIELVTTSSSRDFFQRLIDNDYDLALSGWVADTMDPADFLESVLASYRVPTLENLTVSANSGRLRNHMVDQLIAESRVDSSSRPIELILEHIEKEAPLVPLIYGASSTLVSYRVEGFLPSAMAHYPLTALDLAETAY